MDCKRRRKRRKGQGTIKEGGKEGDAKQRGMVTTQEEEEKEKSTKEKYKNRKKKQEAKNKRKEKD